MSPLTAPAGCCAAARSLPAANAAIRSSGTQGPTTDWCGCIRTNCRWPGCRSSAAGTSAAASPIPRATGAAGAGWAMRCCAQPARRRRPRRSCPGCAGPLPCAPAVCSTPEFSLRLPQGPAGGAVCRPARPVAQLLFVRYLASRPVDEIQCVAQTRRRTRCTAEILGSSGLHGVWTLGPVTVHHGQLALPSDVMAVYSLSALPYQEQLRWRTQRCLDHAAASTAGDLAVADWEPFDPFRHHEHIHTRLPTHGRRPGGHAPGRVWSPCSRLRTAITTSTTR